MCAMSTQTEIKQQVREFYDQIGWQEVSAGLYQNAHYEDLRPVARDYIHSCHLRIVEHINHKGKYLLDAGSGPIQYPEYLEYSKGYQYRVCADISAVALQEARSRIGNHGLFIVADIANLPFKSKVFAGIVSLHTIHHLPEDEHLQAYRELYRLLAPGSSAVIVNGWPSSALMRFFNPMIRISNRVKHYFTRLSGRTIQSMANKTQQKKPREKKEKGTFTNRHDYQWVQETVGEYMTLKILVWRSVSVRFTRALIHSWLGGQFWLWMLFNLEERFPYFFGKNGQYPLIVIHKGTLSGSH